MNRKPSIPPEGELVPITAAELRRRMDRLFSRVAPRVVSEPQIPAGGPSFARIEPGLLVEELHSWIGTN